MKCLTGTLKVAFLNFMALVSNWQLPLQTMLGKVLDSKFQNRTNENSEMSKMAVIVGRYLLWDMETCPFEMSTPLK